MAKIDRSEAIIYSFRFFGFVRMVGLVKEGKTLGQWQKIRNFAIRQSNG